jgi:hypothetical protein
VPVADLPRVALDRAPRVERRLLEVVRGPGRARKGEGEVVVCRRGGVRRDGLEEQRVRLREAGGAAVWVAFCKQLLVSQNIAQSLDIERWGTYP